MLNGATLFLGSRFSSSHAGDPGHRGRPKSIPATPISKQTRMDLIRAFNAELVYIRSPFPMGNKGLALKDGKLSPGGEELQRMIAMLGLAAKPGDPARITEVLIKNDRIHFEINGGPVRRQKWYQNTSRWEATGAPPLLRPVIPMPTRARLVC